ncbi:short transient receptor potential channel 2-like, partial [Protobothrops mucrosquamatus]|uniref:short transient receptor potential channel 2-like n=1 Tax=Protobothrops mucrosquamatus TaxID=103944 RepID=UPI000775D435
MAPLKICCVVSFSSQDPKYPVENLLLEEGLRPWLCCPSDHSRQLRAELQLEQAGCIGYIDVGNSGSAFLQIEVGRSSWPPGRDYLTLLPTATLMMPVDAKLDQNRSGVRMFKEGDLLASALAEKWDRVRVTCSQPFNRHAQFGLAFLRIRTPQDTEGSPGEPAAPSPCQPTNWKEIVNKKLKFPEGLLAAIQDGQLTKIQQMLQISDGILRQLDETEDRPDYLALENLCQEFAFELMGMCRNQSEVTAILNELGDDAVDDDEEMDDQAFEEGIPNLARLRLAVNYNQKRFVAHPVCQQVLSSIWCGSLPSWRGSKSLWKVFVSFSIFLAMPFLALTYFFAPKSKIGKMLKIPVIKFLLHSASYVWFLVFLLVESLILERHQEVFMGRNQSLWETSLHMIWVTGFFWFECKEVWIEGLRSYLLDWWNFLDIVILSMYLASF